MSLIHVRRVTAWLAAVACIGSTPVAAERLPLRNYRSSDGLAHDRVKSILRDSRGFLWFCTVEGLSWFDGHRFITYSSADGLPVQSVNDIVEERPGVYWVAPNGGGVARFDAASRGQRLTSYRLDDGFLSNRVNTVSLDRAGRLWAGTDDGLFSLDVHASQPAARREVLPPDVGTQVARLLSASDGSLWIAASKHAVRRRPNGEYETYAFSGGDAASHIRALAEDASGRIWIGGDAGLALLSLATTGAAVTDLVVDPVGALLRTSSGQMIAGTLSGALLRFDGARVIRHDVANGLPESGILALAEDGERNLWLGTYSMGAFRLAHAGLVTYGRDDGLTDLRIAALLEDRRGRLYALTGNGILSRFEGGRFVSMPMPIARELLATQGDQWQQIVLQARAGDWWFRTPFTAVRLAAVGDAPGAVVHSLDRDLPHRVVERLYEAADGRIWIGLRPVGGSNLAVWDPHAGVREFAGSDAVPADGFPTAFGEDGLGSLWVGFSSGGVVRYRDGRFQSWTTKDGLPRGAVRAFHRDRANRFWVAVGSGGLCQIRDEGTASPAFELWTKAEGLPSNNTRALAEDGAGRLYVGTELGVSRIDPGTRSMRVYTTADGLASNEVEVALTARDGSLWFGTYNGLSRLTPEDDAIEETPAVWIHAVRVADRSLPLDALGSSSVTVPPIDPDENRVEVEFGGLEFGAKGALNYEYRLQGVDRQWQRGTDERRVTYARLGAGHYRFEVRAVRESGAPGPAPAVVEFTVRPPIWLRPSFLALAALLMLAGGYALHRARVGRLLELERIRLRIATDLHDDIGASLSRIAVLSEVARRRLSGDPHDADGPLVRIAATSREVLDAMSDIVWAINPQRDSLDDLIRRMRRFVNDVLASRGVQVRFVAPEGVAERLGHDVRRQLLLVLKESTTNISRHAESSEVCIELRMTSGELTLVVRDNGRGFEAGPGDGHGLANMRRRVEDLGGTLDVRSAPGGGTELIATVPAHPRARARATLPG